MRKFRFLAVLLFSSLLLSCQDNTDISNSTDNEVVDPSLLNKSDEVDGVHYSLKNVSINSELIVLNEKNSRLVSIKGNTYKIEITTSAIALAADKVIYLQAEGKTYLLKINSLQFNNNIYTLQTEAAGLGNLFQSGSLELSVDVDKAQNLIKERSAKSGSVAFQNGLTFDIFNFVKPFESNNFTANLNSSLKTYFNVKMSFGSSRIMPSMFEITYELHPSINPYFTTARGVNASYNLDYADYLSSNIADALKSIDISVDIPLGDLGTLPAKVGIDQISIPSDFVVNASQEIDMHFNTSGVFKIGYVYYDNVPNQVSHMIYENSIVGTSIDGIKLYGELSTNNKIVITPRISLVDNDLIQVEGQISFGLRTFTTGGISTATNEYVSGSTGTFESKGSIKAGTLGLKIFSVDLLDQSKELWNVGSINKKFTVSDLTVAKPSKTQSSLRSYNFDITAKYRYPIYGKKITSTIEVTYDVYDDRKSVLAAGQKVTLQTRNITESNFTFNLCVPFRINALGFTTGFTRNTGYIRNIKITDALGNVAEGPTEIALGSPYNTSFWK